MKALELNISEEKTITVYRGTVSEVLRAENNALKQQMAESVREYEKRHKEHWERICASLNLDPDGDYSLGYYTGQVFERVPESKLAQAE